MEPVNKHKRTMHLLFGKQRPGRGENAEKNAEKCGKMRIAFISPPCSMWSQEDGIETFSRSASTFESCSYSDSYCYTEYMALWQKCRNASRYETLHYNP